uniref:2-oxoacid:ferredoxin oxidoreductase subunit gamma n=1 Tax=Desulfatirhabdium butyrativorans TaxID=340467 RepID=A0A7C4ML63_9BACT
MKPYNDHRELLLAGSGGQGLILAAVLLAEAAILEDKRVVQTQSYGIATRGGLSTAELIIDSREILFQQIECPDVVLALTDEALKRYAIWAKRGVPIYYDTTLTELRPDPPCFGYPFTKVAGELGNERSVNLLAIGLLAARTGVVHIESLKAAIRNRWGKRSAANERMVEAGADLAPDPPMDITPCSSNF